MENLVWILSVNAHFLSKSYAFWIVENVFKYSLKWAAWKGIKTIRYQVKYRPKAWFSVGNGDTYSENIRYYEIHEIIHRVPIRHIEFIEPVMWWISIL